jgi:hypothetical protein
MLFKLSRGDASTLPFISNRGDITKKLTEFVIT